MNAPEPSPAAVASPCVGICRVDGEDMCVGCGRLIGEIVEWTRVSEARRRDIVTVAAGRLSRSVAPSPG